MSPQIMGIVMWALGIGIIALILLIMMILFGNLQGNVGFGQTSATFVNNTVTLGPLTNVTSLIGRESPSLTGILVVNSSNSSKILSTGNYTFDAGRINGTATSEYLTKSVNVSGTINYDTQGEVDSRNLIINYTASAVNTGKQLPTVGTILGIAILLAILIGVLIFAIRRLMSVTNSTTGGGSNSDIGGGGSSGRKSGRFSGSSSSDFG